MSYSQKAAGQTNQNWTDAQIEEYDEKSIENAVEFYRSALLRIYAGENSRGLISTSERENLRSLGVLRLVVDHGRRYVLTPKALRKLHLKPIHPVASTR